MIEESKENIKIQHRIGNLLRWGVIVSMLVTLLGGIVYVYRHGTETPDYAVFNDGNLPTYTSFSQVIEGILAHKGRAVIILGILLLIFTPIMRVVLSIVNFFVERDYLYMLIGLIVLAIISISLLGGFTH